MLRSISVVIIMFLCLAALGFIIREAMLYFRFSSTNFEEVSEQIFSALDSDSLTEVRSLVSHPYRDDIFARSWENAKNAFVGLVTIDSGVEAPRLNSPFEIPDGFEIVSGFGACPERREYVAAPIIDEYGSTGILKIFYYPAGSGKVCDIHLLKKLE